MATKIKFDVQIVPGWPVNIRDELNNPVPPSSVPIPPPPGGFREIGNIRWKYDDPTYCLILNATGGEQYLLCNPPHTLMRIQVDIESGGIDSVTAEDGSPATIATLACDAAPEPFGGYREVANLRWFRGSNCIVLNVIGGGQYKLCT